MEQKKSAKADLRSKIILYVLAGLNVALLITLVSLVGINKPVKQFEEEKEEEVVVFADEIPVVELPDNTPPPPPPPPDAPPPPPPPPDVITEIEETPEPEPEIKPEIKPDPQPQPQLSNVRLSNVKPTTVKPKPKPKAKEKTRKEEVSAREVDIMAIYPGCEKDRAYKKASTADAKKKALIACMTKRLKGDLESELDIDLLTDHAQDEDKSRMAVKLNFLVDTKGNIIGITPSNKGDAFMKPEAKKALQQVAKRIQRKGGMTPAKYADGTPVRLKYSIPVTFKLEQ